MRGTLPPGGRLVTMFNWVFRHEPSPRATRMQAFRVREFVRAGQVDEVLAWRDEWVRRGQALLESLELPAQPEVAADPFFGRAGRMLASNQKELKLKYELLLPADSALEPTAVCSFNFHQQHFGSTYGIRTSEGASASSACLGFGLERVTMALFRAHGFDSERWPRPVRHRLWP
jgi:seryl-tRNA synthetase